MRRAAIRSRPRDPLFVEYEAFCQIVTLAARDPERECCGLLLGNGSSGERIVRQVISSPNVAGARLDCRFQIDWTTLLLALSQKRADGLKLVGFYHSHPRGGAEPSAEDHRFAWPGYSYVIVGMQSCGPGWVRSWRGDRFGDTFQEEAIVPEPGAAGQSKKMSNRVANTPR
jgi:proteasome lid subunit RPN8/RPN11